MAAGVLAVVLAALLGLGAARVFTSGHPSARATPGTSGSAADMAAGHSAASRSGASKAHASSRATRPGTSRPGATKPGTSTFGAGSGHQASSARAAAGRSGTSCRSVAHIGDSTSVGLVSPLVLPDPAQRLAAQYRALARAFPRSGPSASCVIR